MKKAQNKKKNNRKKLGSLVLLLTLTVVMLGVSTYAWFTSNKTVTVSSLDVKVEAKSGLQISADGFNWKTTISNADILGAASGSVYPSAINQIPIALEPTSTAGKLKTDSTGHLQMFNGVIEDANDGSGEYVLMASSATDTAGIVGNYIVFDLFLRTEVAATIYLTPNSSVVAKGTDKGLKNAARVAFVQSDPTTITATDAPLTTIQALKATLDSHVQVWEPNFDSHTQSAVNAASSIYGITTITAGESVVTNPRIGYDGVQAPIASPGIKLAQAKAVTNPAEFASITPSIVTSTGYATETFNELAPYKTVMSLPAGISKVRVYMWIEGQDVDCENDASGYDITFNVQFSLNSY